MKTNFKDIDFPENTLSPTEKTETASGWVLDWNYKNLVSGYQIAMTMPEKHLPHPSRSDHKFPCSGPHCSRGSQSPLQPVTTISSTAEHWALAQFSLILKDREPVQPAPPSAGS